MIDSLVSSGVALVGLLLLGLAAFGDAGILKLPIGALGILLVIVSAQLHQHNKRAGK
ncbi:MAG: hypothetical protein HOP28_12250 [Gemmatimonadales bacterium]|nr:hypothetical protein [Gemmatimonadales bacterium]